MHSYDIVEQGQPLDKASRALIMLHGRGGSAQDILQLATDLCNDTFYIAAPQATNCSWYPYSFLEEEQLNEPWLSSAIDTVKRLIDETATKITRDQIFLLGFSQGACLALEASSKYATKYGGVVAFTGGLIGKTVNAKKYSGTFRQTKVFIGNSDIDPHVPLVRSEESKNIMEKLDADVTLKVYKGMAHTINLDEIQWVKKHLLT